MMPTSATPVTRPTDMTNRRALMEQFFATPTTLPLSFVLDETPIAGIPAAWQPVAMQRRLDANLTETVSPGTDPRTGLHVRVECLIYHDYPVVEWVVWLTNNGQAATPILRDILIMDSVISGSSPVLSHCNGDFYRAEGYTPQETPLVPGDTLTFAPNGGRPCDGAFPYYRLRFADGGLSLAIGWPAQWAATFSGSSDGVCCAGQETTNLRLLPGKAFAPHA
ncbi:MAG: hypothetical protein R3E79_09665 [Caldilineaceae bacterium]